MGKTKLSAWRLGPLLTLFLYLQLLTAVLADHEPESIVTATAESQVEAEAPPQQPLQQQQPSLPIPNQQSEGQVVIQTQTASFSQGPQDNPRRMSFNKPRFQVTHQRFRSDPYANAMKPQAEAQDRIIHELVTAATIVPKIFGGEKPFWVPHKYFNLCSTVNPDDGSMWALGCQGFPYQTSNGQTVPWASQQATAGAGGAGAHAEAGTSGWSHAPLSTYAAPFNVAPNNILGLPPGYLGFPSMYPYYANPNPSMPPPAFPSFVSNTDATAMDMGNLWSSSGGTTGPSGPSAGGSTISSMFFNSLGMGGNPAATGGQLYSNGQQSNNGMAFYSQSGPGYGGGGVYSGTGFGGGGVYSGTGFGGGGGGAYAGSGYGDGGGPPFPMTPYPFPYAIGILPMGMGMDYGYGPGWPGSPGDYYNRNESKDSSSSAAAAASSSAKTKARESRKKAEKNDDETE